MSETEALLVVRVNPSHADLATRTVTARAIVVVAVVMVGTSLAACSSDSSVVRPATAPASTRSSMTAPLSAATPTTAPTSPTPHPTIMITPGTGLKDRQTVRVTAAGFTPGEALAVVECAGKGTGTGPGDCNLAALTPATADTTGAVSVRLLVVVGPFGANHVSCGKPHSCLVSVTQATLAPTEEADAPIKFGA